MVRTPRVTTDGYLRKHKPDYTIVLITSLLLIFGAILVYTISPALNQTSVLYRQLGHILLATISFIIAANLPINFWKNISQSLLGGALIISLLLLIPGLGREVNGATRWLDLGPISFQPSELLKFALVIYIAGWLAERIRTNKLNHKSESLIPMLTLTAVAGIFIAFLQKDLGTMISVSAVLMCMYLVSGVKLGIFFKYIGALVSAGVASIILFPHRMERLFTFLRPETDIDGTGYHINQALIAIGSGGWFGRGLGKSVQVFGYLPEAINDSIFAIVAEQFGFVGSMLVLFLYIALSVRLLMVIERAPTMYMKLITAGVFGWLISHVMINVGAMLGIVPLTGITLPFLSIGGTSLVFITAGFGLVFNISRYTSLAYVKEESHENMVGWRGNRRTRPTASSAGFRASS